MRPVVITQTGTGLSSVVVLDQYQRPFDTGIGCTVSGTVSYTVLHTFDDVHSPTFSSATATWFSHDDTALVGATTNQNGNFAYPVRAAAVRNTGTGSVTVTFLQGISGN